MLRNRVAHREAVIQWNLSLQSASIVQLTFWLSPAAGNWCKRHSRFPEIYPDDGTTLAR